MDKLVRLISQSEKSKSNVSFVKSNDQTSLTLNNDHLNYGQSTSALVKNRSNRCDKSITTTDGANTSSLLLLDNKENTKDSMEHDYLYSTEENLTKATSLPNPIYLQIISETIKLTNPPRHFSSFKKPEQTPIQTVKKTKTLTNSKLEKPIALRLKRGYAIIFDQEKFQRYLSLSTRTGTKVDVTSLRETLEKFNIFVNVKHDYTVDKIKQEVEKLQTFDFIPYDCLVVVILTHGKMDNILYANDGSYNLYDIIVNPIVTINKSLAGKPKIFIIQACKGSTIPYSDIPGSPGTDGSEFSYNLQKPTKVPVISDMFFAFATYEGHVSFRNTKTGGYFIQTFCRMLSEYGSTKPIELIMVDVTRELSSSHNTQVSTSKSTMTKPFIFGNIGKELNETE